MDVLEKCKKEGYPITASGLYYSGKKYGFLIKKEDSRILEFNKEKFFDWLAKAKKEIPEGWVPLRELPALFGISLSKAYTLVKDEKSGADKFGAGPGVIYVDPNRIKSIIEERNENHKEKWGD